MHLLLRDHRSWLLTALFVAVTHVQQGECDDGLVQSIVQSGKTGYLKTYEKTYHTKYEFDLNDALHQTGRLLRKLASPVVAVERDPALINEEQLQEAAIHSEEYCDSEEEELIRKLHSKGYRSKADGLHENFDEEDGGPEKGHAKERIFNIGRLFFKPTVFKKTHQKKIRDPDTHHRQEHHRDDHLQIHDDPDTFLRHGDHSDDPDDGDTFLRSGRQSEEHPNTTEVTDVPSAEEDQQEEPVIVGDPLPSSEDTVPMSEQQSEELLPTSEETTAPSEDEHQTTEDEEQPCTTVTEETIIVGKPHSKPKYYKKKKLHEPDIVDIVHHEHHSGQYLKEQFTEKEHSAEDGQLHPKEVIIEVGKPLSMLNLFKKKLEKTFHTTDSVHSHEHHSHDHHSEEEHQQKYPPPSSEKDIILGKSLIKSRVFQRLHKPTMVSVLKNFKLMFHIPIKFSKYEAKHSLEPVAKTECEDEEVDDYGLIT